MNPPPLILRATSLLLQPPRPSRYICTSQVLQSPHLYTLMTFPRISYSCSHPLLCPLTIRIMKGPGVTPWENLLGAHVAKTTVYVLTLALYLPTPAILVRVSIFHKGRRARGRISQANQKATKARNPKLWTPAGQAKPTGTVHQMVAIFLRLLIDLRGSRLARLNPVQWLSSEGGRKSPRVEVMMKMRTIYLLYLRFLSSQDLRVRSHSNAVCQYHHHSLVLGFLL